MMNQPGYRYLILLFALCMMPRNAVSAGIDPLMAKMRQQLMKVGDYTCDITLNAKLPRMNVSQMRMKLYYKRPNKTHVEAKEGFAILPKEGLYLGNPIEEMIKKFDAKRIGIVNWQSRKCVKYALYPKTDADAHMGSIRFYIDSSRALPAGLTGKLDSGEEISTIFQYALVGGKYWLPSATTLKVSGLDPDSALPTPSRKKGDASDMGKAALTFTNYKVNIGLSDTLFQQPKKPAVKMRAPQ